MKPDTDPEDVIPALTPYPILRLGKVKLLPYFLPGDPETGAAVRGLTGKRPAVLRANHGPVVAGKNLEASIYAMEELEEGAKMALTTRGMEPIGLSAEDVAKLRLKYPAQSDNCRP